MKFIHETAQIKGSEIGDVKAYRNVVINDSIIKDGCSVGDDTTIERCDFEEHVVINRRSYINDSCVGSYTYMGINTTMNFTHIGRFCSIGRNADIGGLTHDYHKVTTMPVFRFNQTINGGGKIPQAPTSDEYCEIGNDVWIAAGVHIMRKVKIGDGAVIGANAVVTKDVPPYAIAVGVPAKVIGYRCAEDQIERLLKIKWWFWSEEKIKENMQVFMSEDISDEVLDRMEEIQGVRVLSE